MPLGHDFMNRRFAAFSSTIPVVLALVASSAAASPADAKRGEAARLQHQIEVQADRVSALDEQFNQARLRVEKTRAAADQTAADLARANTQFGVVRQRMAHHAVDAYVHGGSTTTIGQLLAGSGNDVIARRQYLEAAAANGRRAADELKAAREDLTALRSRDQAAQQEAQASAGQVEANRRAVNAAIAAQQATLGKVNGELADLVRAEQARKAADDAQRAQAEVAARQKPAPPAAGLPKTASNAVRSVTAPLQPAPGVARGAAAAVEEARRQVGKPYVYGGSGPDTFDCSGLTSWAWRAGGVSLPHSASAQYAAVTHISFSELQPGDLLFYYSDIHHVAMYVGGGQIVEASHSGEPVKYSSVNRGEFIGAGRPA